MMKIFIMQHGSNPVWCRVHARRSPPTAAINVADVMIDFDDNVILKERWSKKPISIELVKMQIFTAGGVHKLPEYKSKFTKMVAKEKKILHTIKTR